jgi:hypothetical protein
MVCISKAKETISAPISNLCFSIFLRKAEVALQAMVLRDSGAPSKLQQKAAASSYGNNDLNLMEMI